MALPAVNDPNKKPEDSGLSLVQGGNSGAAKPDTQKPELSVVEGGQPELSVVPGGLSEDAGRSNYLGPESVTLQPESARRAESLAENNPITGGTGQRVTAEEQANLAPDAPDVEALFERPPITQSNTATPPVSGSSDLPAGEDTPPVTGKPSAAQGGLRKLMGRFGLGKKQPIQAATGEEDGASKLEQAKEGLKNEVKEEVKTQARQWVKRQVKAWIAKTIAVTAGPEILIVVGIILILVVIIFLIIGIVAAPRRQGDPVGAIGVSSSTLASLQTAQNPEGMYCRELSPSVTQSKTGAKVMMPALQGEVWEEEEAVAPGQLAPTAKKQGPLSMKDVPRNNTVDQGKIGFTNEELKYYVNMRWMYTGWLFDGKAVTQGGEVRPSDYAGRNIGFARVKVVNGKVSIGSIWKGKIAETGPAPWTGTGYTSDDGKIIASSTGIELPDQKLIWGKSPRLDTPKEYSGRVLGIAPELHRLASTDGDDINGDFVIVGFLPDNTVLDGQPIPCTQIRYSPPGSGASLGGVEQPLKVPGVSQSTAGDCGQASAIMAMLYYNPGYRDPFFFNPDTMQTVDKDANGNANTACMATPYINRNTDGKATDFMNAYGPGYGNTESTRATMENVKASLLAGDPVMCFTSGIYTKTSNKDGHVILLVGYNSNTKTFWANNPYKGGVDVATDTINGHQLTESFLSAHLGDSIYQRAFTIRKKYLDL